MNLDPIEALLLPSLKRLLGRKVDVVPGPAAAPALGGMRPMVFVHARSFADGGGITPEGDRVARRPLREGRMKGFAEERPGRIVIEVTCLAQAYRTVKDLSGVISPQVLRSLESLTELAVGKLPNGQARLTFADFAASLAGAEFRREGDDDIAWHVGRLVFHLEGFLHVRVTGRGGLAPKPRVRPAAGAKKKAKKKKKPRG